MIIKIIIDYIIFLITRFLTQMIGSTQNIKSKCRNCDLTTGFGAISLTSNVSIISKQHPETQFSKTLKCFHCGLDSTLWCAEEFVIVNKGHEEFSHNYDVLDLVVNFPRIEPSIDERNEFYKTFCDEDDSLTIVEVIHSWFTSVPSLKTLEDFCLIKSPFVASMLFHLSVVLYIKRDYINAHHISHTCLNMMHALIPNNYTLHLSKNPESKTLEITVPKFVPSCASIPMFHFVGDFLRINSTKIPIADGQTNHIIMEALYASVKTINQRALETILKVEFFRDTKDVHVTFIDIEIPEGKDRIGTDIVDRLLTIVPSNGIVPIGNIFKIFE